MFVFPSYSFHKFRFYQGFYRLSRRNISGQGIPGIRDQASPFNPGPSSNVFVCLFY